MSKFDEMITVVPRNTIFNNETYQFDGFKSIQDEETKYIYETINQYETKRRGDMEEDPSYKQLISYCILENENNEVLVYERLTGGGEGRLHGLSSIGVGGHMNDVPNATNVEEVIRENAARELEEEVGLSKKDVENMELIGFINDDQNEVGKVHIGVVFKLKVQKESVEAIETDTLKINWVNQSELSNNENYETWSSLIIDGIYRRGE
ncbi:MULTISPECIES: NUDIX domain-containing protein [Mammaliicoccus]|uniref:NUDIX domain-containing protein n=1 Tax=Mammaliicoccus fleurettii TaxID=150056 RepID=A0ABS5MNG9_9STAP|nr:MULTISPECIES: NUDIX domain-containing protein [Mammaliicoccus]MBL0847681.1 NUDIX domain-containing protein [Mammaliicoccus fleurettii]MBS3672414.1 NUDIX domain-containing protein [Mammaliicoccus fleurettii]MBS3697465.1 NUDIX domain-containing protein [Mammaliicoccus fleurettii]MBW0764245.1 NUDIX domain-containing protein [Mammaliicoccus fleurettii]PTE35047.1 DNA mismatch repair protein MutT [Mammaliicoccus fleurettii]